MGPYPHNHIFNISTWIINVLFITLTYPKNWCTVKAEKFTIKYFVYPWKKWKTEVQNKVQKCYSFDIFFGGGGWGQGGGSGEQEEG